MDLNDLLREGTAILGSRKNALQITSACLQKPIEWLLTHPEQNIEHDVAEKLGSWFERYSREEPMAYITSTIDFCGLTLRIDNRALSPRPETELMVDAAVKLNLRRSAKVLDLCTGSGCIAAALKTRRTDLELFASDLSLEALALAKSNVGEVHLLGCNMLDGLKEEQKFDLILCNPPYVALNEMTELPDSVKKYEPLSALDGGEGGLVFYRNLCHSVPAYLRSGGFLVLEIGYNQSDEVTELLSGSGWDLMEVIKDSAGIPRTVVAQWSH